MGEKHRQASTDHSGQYSAHFLAAARYQAAAHHHLQAAHHEELGQHAEAIRHAEAALRHGSMGHKIASEPNAPVPA